MIQEFMNVSKISSDLLLDGFTLMFVGHIAVGRNQLVPIGKIHYFFHWLYGKYEPQCVRVCQGKTRAMVKRPSFAHDHVIPSQVLLKDMSMGNGKQAG